MEERAAITAGFIEEMIPETSDVETHASPEVSTSPPPTPTIVVSAPSSGNTFQVTAVTTPESQRAARSVQFVEPTDTSSRTPPKT